MNAKVPSVASGHGHSRLRKLPFALLILAASIGNAHAQWNSASPAGLGVINFNSTDTRKIIFTDKARSTESGRTISTANWNNYLSTKSNAQLRNFNSFVPETSQGQGAFYTAGTLKAKGMTTGTFVFNHVSKASSGSECVDGNTCSAATGTSVGTSSCVSQEISISATGSFTRILWGGEASGVVNGSFTKGWSSCQTRSQNHSCQPIRVTGYRTINWPVTENRSRIGWTTLTDTTTSRLAHASNSRTSSLKTKCNQAGGSYVLTGRPQGYFHSCNNLENKITFEDYGYWPAADMAVSLDCRLTGRPK